ncbi:MAG: TonB-dependent receptor [Thermoflexibacteraceae bacterium]
MKNKSFILIFLLLSHFAIAQKNLVGKVIDQQNQPIFAANVYWKNAVTTGTTTDFEGVFQLVAKQLPDTLVVSFIGYETRTIVINKVSDTLQVTLLSSAGVLEEVAVVAQDPISQDFSVTKLDKIQIYTNPLAAGDALKAITLLPASTNTEETANPVLRGSSADRSRVVLNGVPIYNPVRNSQLNGLGNFSLFNTEIIQKMYVYASNPPLTFGNSSAGLIEIETVKKLPTNQLQIALSLANAGAFWSKKIGKKSFVQLYGNRQFADAFLGLNKQNIPRLNNFMTTDFGCNSLVQINENVTWNSFVYLIDEGFSFKNHSYTYEGTNLGNKQRGFWINNVSKKYAHSLLTFNSLADKSRQNYSFGNLQSVANQEQFFAGLNYKYFGFKNITWQTGVQYDYSNYHADFTAPIYFYAFLPTAPTFKAKNIEENHLLEWYFYTSWDILPELNLSVASRLNLPTQAQKFHNSKQLSLRYQPSKQHRWLLSGGNYYNYSTPNYLNSKFVLLDSWQAALDYDFKGKNIDFSTALFYKNEGGEQNLPNGLVSNQVKTVGFEVAVQKEIGQYVVLNVANTFLSQNQQIGEKEFRTADDMAYFVKAVATFRHPKIASLSVSYMTREGRYYTPIVGAMYQPTIDTYQPIWSQNINSAQYGAYHNVSLTANRVFKVGKAALVVFASVNNLLNTQNERQFLFEKGYQNWTVDTYQLRTFYMGVVWQWNY